MLSQSRLLLSLLSLAAAGAAGAAELSLNLEIPNLPVAEYHRPYVAIWVEGPDQTIATNLAVWYNLRGDHTKWLPDLRQWWRRGGRDLKVPADGLTGATRPVGQHILKFDARAEPLSKLPPGKYALVVEAVREVGGRETVRLPFDWPITGAKRETAQGSKELGAVALTLNP